MFVWWIVDQIIFVCGFYLEQIHSSSSTETIRFRPVSHLLNKFPAWETVVDIRVVDVDDEEMWRLMKLLLLLVELELPLFLAIKVELLLPLEHLLLLPH